MIELDSMTIEFPDGHKEHFFGPEEWLIMVMDEVCFPDNFHYQGCN